ncbi:MAG TPA: transcriptional regulator [Telluria sp.]|jgi:hypothetical protein
MKPHYVLAAAIAATSVLALAAAPEPLPAAWIVTGTNASSFEGGVDQSDGFKGAKFIRNKTGEASVTGALGQMISAQNYLGHRVRFRARVRTDNVTNWAGLWMRIDTPDRSRSPFYNSYDKPIKGTTGWQERSVVLDVPMDARTVVFGVNNSGTGQVWIDQLALETVGADVPVDTAPAGQQKLPLTPSL